MQEHTQRVDESLVVHLLYLREVAPVSAQIPNTSLLWILHKYEFCTLSKFAAILHDKRWLCVSFGDNSWKNALISNAVPNS